MEPVLEVPRQHAWQGEPNRVLDLGTLAHLVAQGLIAETAVVDEAARNGYDGSRLEAMIQLQLVGPPVAEALELWRRGRITEAQVDHALAKAQVEDQYHAGIKDLFNERLQPEAIATAVQRGILPNAGLLPVGPPSAVGVVEPMPEVPLDPLAEAQASGYDFHRIAAPTRIVGLPPAPGELLDLLNRGVIEDADFYRGVAEGNTRNEWGAVLYQLRHFLLSPEKVATLRLKGWIDQATANTLGALRGADAAVMENLYLSLGRPAAPVQMQTAWARGVDGPDGVPMDEAQYLKGIRESDIRPEWGPMLWGIRYAYPSLFQLRRAVEDGSITAARALTILQYERYEAQDAQALVASWTKGGAAAQKELTKTEILTEYEGLFMTAAQATAALELLGMDPTAVGMELELADARRVNKARDAVVKAVHDAYVAHSIDATAAAAGLADVNISQPAIDNLVHLWGLERDESRRSLTQAQIKRAYVRGLITFDQATAALEDLGYTLAAAQEYLAE